MRILNVVTAGLALAYAVAQPAETSPFARYHESIEQALAGMIERGAEPPPAATAEPGPAASKPLPPPRQVSGALARVERLRPVLERILMEEGVPPALAAVVLVESGGQPDALSPKAARGLWQFIPETAREYGLEVGPRADERLHIEKSTRAAARFLSDLYARFGDWKLALAAYNAGPGAVDKALARGGKADFSRARAYLPQETRRYVPAVMSAMKQLAPNGRHAPVLQ